MRMTFRFGIAALLAAAVAAAAASAAPYGGPGSYGRGFQNGLGFGARYGAPRGWNNGRWAQGWYGRRQGWNVGPGWYSYAQPAYPYANTIPDIGYGGGFSRGDIDTTYYPAYAYSGYGLDPNGYNPPSPYQYYCANPRGFYPQVRDCDEWQQYYQGKPVSYDDYERYN